MKNQLKTPLIVLLFLCLTSTLLHAQELEIKTKRAINTNENLLSFSEEEGREIASIFASGSVHFLSPEGHVRIIVANKNGYEKIIYESFSLLGINGIDHFSSQAIETSNLEHFVPHHISIQIKDASLKDLKLETRGVISLNNTPSVEVSMLNTGIKQPVRRQGYNRQNYINNLNLLLEMKGELWRAGDTQFSRLSYEQKKLMFGGEVPNLNGAEYYIGGILDLSKGKVLSYDGSSTSMYIDEFDWRNRHSANIEGSPYFQDPIAGWITPAKNQGACNSCWAFSAVGAIESIIKLYRNTTYNPDLSEQEIVSCSNGGDCIKGGAVYYAMKYATNNYVQDEYTFQYKAKDLPCSDKSPFFYSAKIDDCSLFLSTGNNFKDSEKLKSLLIKSPIASRINEWHHAMTLVGYKTIKAGDKIMDNLKSPIIIHEGDPRIGKTAWIFKNSWGKDWGVGGFLYVFADTKNMNQSVIPSLSVSMEVRSPKSDNMSLKGNFDDVADYLWELYQFLNSPIQAYDKDNDGYYWWGIGPRPNNLPVGAALEADADDTNPSIGAMDTYGFPRIIHRSQKSSDNIASLSISVSKISKLATISYKLPSGSYLLSITNLNEGKTFINKLSLSDQLHKQDVNIQSFTKGCYLAVIHDKEGRIIASSKFIIED